MSDGPEFVIGQELADAHAADERRRLSDPPPSPLPPERYRPERGELGLFSIEHATLDDALTGFVQRFRAVTPDARTELRAGLGLEDAYTLLAFARRSAVFAMRTGDAAHVADGLGACAALAWERIDQRDGMVALALLLHAGRRCGAGARSLFEGAEELGEPAFAAHVRGLLGRPESERDVQAAWGFIEAEGPHGVGFLGWAYGPWSPTVDLASLALRVAAALRGDDYTIDDPTLGADLPAVWLDSSAGQEIEAALGRVRAGAVIQGHLLAGRGADPATQQLTAWLVETDGPEDAASLLRPVPTMRLAAGLGLASGSLFLLVIGRSVVHGVESLETRARLARFRGRLREALAR